MICGNSRILRIDLQSSDSDSFQKNEPWISYAELTLLY
ncbi:hypothetical protein LEP1GSC188_1370 [Leptospira weilii serovar Topaz str. LT2116]|uniref:Uncharacterized protein n=1 Tax=Leptospira weilii serovar Topaz str. LT2116 TaxID=1088540 RepID=M3GBZ4_9LEPT|nr:hypothetical protein LEP1GSC188_1370 [Leptospira weilii serovar Topaz str. LT2116]